MDIRRLVAAGLVALTLGTAVIACGDDTGDTGGTGDGSTETTVTETETDGEVDEETETTEG